MSFEKLKKSELVRTATEDFGMDVDKSHTKKQLIAELDDFGVTWEMYLDENPEAAEAFKEVPSDVITVQHVPAEEFYDVATVKRQPPTAEAMGERILVKMTRRNPYYQVRQYEFTQDNPYALVKLEDADFILLEEEGFRQATPREVQEYYS